MIRTQSRPYLRDISFGCRMLRCVSRAGFENTVVPVRRCRGELGWIVGRRDLSFGPQGSFLTLTSLIEKSFGDATPLSRKFHPQPPTKLASLTFQLSSCH
jgi:hypothetical protein